LAGVAGMVIGDWAWWLGWLTPSVGLLLYIE
jgi:hypothetical protein